MSVVGLIGILVFFAGAHLLWQARRDVLYWTQEFFRILRVEFSRRGGLEDDAQRVPAEAYHDPVGQGVPVPASDPSGEDLAEVRRKHNSRTLLLLGGFGLMVLGQVLFLLDLAL